MIRSLYAIDLVALLFLGQRLLPNEAITRDRLGGASLLAPRDFLEHWFPLGGRRYTWVWQDRGRILGVVSARSCCGPTAWQIDHLRVSDEERCLALLNKASAFGAEQGVKKVFLRLHSGSPLIDGARRSGFSCYTKECLYRYDGEGKQMTVEMLEPYLLRPRSSGDEYRLFELYSAAVPAPVRTVEGTTLEEWRESRDRGSWLGRRREFVLQKQGSVVGWLQISAVRGMGYFEVIFHPAEQEGLERLVNWGLMCLDGKSPLFCIVSAFQGQLRRLLERLGFQEVAEYCTLVKEIALKVREPSFMPVQA